MRNLKITLAYDGADFNGWQVQPARRTVQGCLAEAMERLTGKYVLPQGSGRTDAGVHALAQVATCEFDSPIPAANLVIALNNMLPPAIRVHQVEDVPPDFMHGPLRRPKRIATVCTGVQYVRHSWRDM
jgi:tRNA pseudouridine38-40 synthase